MYIRPYPLLDLALRIDVATDINLPILFGLISRVKHKTLHSYRIDTQILISLISCKLKLHKQSDIPM